jgi:aldehyde dehydrogenase (NAD+)
MEPLKLVETPVEAVAEVVTSVRSAWQDLRSIPIGYRASQLRSLRKMIEDNITRFEEAVWKDLRKSRQEFTMGEINLILTDISYALTNLQKWSSPRNAQKDLVHQFDKMYLMSEPYGTVLIIAPWNYPIGLLLEPLIGAIAAGNACVLKPSELSVATSNLMSELVPQYLDKDLYQVVTGGVGVATELLRQRFDYIFFTGSTAVGKIVMRCAAEHLTPCTLELGGKSPVLVADDANIEVAARRIMWGKCINAGQSCIAPDYVLCTEAIRDQLIETCKATLTEFYGEDVKGSKDFGRIIHSRHFQRLKTMLDGVKDKVVSGGEADESDLFISPTLLSGVTASDGVMQEEVFGPLLPFVTVENMDQAIQFVRDREKPLALYVFTEDSSLLQKVLHSTSAGGVVHNDVLQQYSVSSLPFGGVGHSGFGAYHGKASFDTFSHYKPVLCTPAASYLENVNSIRCPPYSESKIKEVNKLQLPPEGLGGGTSRALRITSLVLQGMAGRRQS